MTGGSVTLPLDLVERVIIALDRDLLSRPSSDEMVPGVEHECEYEDGDRICEFSHDQWLTRFHPNPLAEALRAHLALSARGVTRVCGCADNPCSCMRSGGAITTPGAGS